MSITLCAIFKMGKVWIMDSSLAHANFGSLHTTNSGSGSASEFGFGFGYHGTSSDCIEYLGSCSSIC
jgi:hypothetical protein